MEANDNDYDVDRGPQPVSKPVDVCLMKAKNVELTIEEAQCTVSWNEEL